MLNGSFSPQKFITLKKQTAQLDYEHITFFFWYSRYYNGRKTSLSIKAMIAFCVCFLTEFERKAEENNETVSSAAVMAAFTPMSSTPHHPQIKYVSPLEPPGGRRLQQERKEKKENPRVERVRVNVE